MLAHIPFLHIGIPIPLPSITIVIAPYKASALITFHIRIFLWEMWVIFDPSMGTSSDVALLTAQSQIGRCSEIAEHSTEA